MDDINPIIPSDWGEILKEYIKNVKLKHSEHNKRSYFKSTILERVFKIDPKDIDYDENANDLYFAGILFETKRELNRSTRIDGLEELSRYLKEKPYTKICILTDCISFEIYEPSNLTNPKDTFSIDQPNINESKEDYERRVFNKLYTILYPDLQNLEPVAEIIVPRIKNLIEKWVNKIEVKEDNIKYLAWKSYVSKAFGSESDATTELFKKHALLYYTSLVLTARAIGYEDTVEEIIRGSPFIADGILNYVEEDSFFDFLEHNHSFFKDLDMEVSRYNFKEGIANNVFIILYEDLISPSERHSLGEFYTPEWLAKILVEKAVSKNDIVLDPACGSGTFLRCVIEEKKALGKNPNEIFNEVIGFDINPIAVTIAKANYLITMKSMNVKPEIIPVFLADSLLPLENTISKDYRVIDEYNEERTGYISINFDEIIEGAGNVPFKFYRDWDIKTITKYLSDLSKGKDKYNINGDVLRKIEALKKQGKNHIWFYILRNIYTPYYFMRKVDVVIGNPPWITYKDVKNIQRQKFLDSLYEKYKMKAGGENKTQQDMAGFFIVRCKEYLKPKGKIAFVLTRSVFNGAQYEGLRRGSWNLYYPIDETKEKIKRKNKKTEGLWFSYIWDIKANPFHKPSCMILLSEKKERSREIPGAIIIASEEKPEQKVDIRKPFTPIESPRKFYINLTENYSGISEENILFEEGRSMYRDYFNQGASIVPRPYYFVKILEEKLYGVKVITDPIYTTYSNKKRRRGEFKFSYQDNWVPKELIYTVILGEDIEPFKINLSRKAVLPIVNGKFIFNQTIRDHHYIYSLKGEYTDLQEYQLYEQYEKIFNDIEKDWEVHRGEKFLITENAKESSKKSVWGWLNYNNKLLSQFGKSGRFLVVYNEGGQKIRSGVIENPKNIVVEHKAYYSYFNDKEEAYYVCGILNSNYLLELLKNSGILAERNIEKKPFDVPIPKYDKNNEIHFKIATLSMKISELVDKNVELKEIEKLKEKLEEAVKEVLMLR